MISVSLKRTGRAWVAAAKVITSAGARSHTVRGGTPRQVLQRVRQWVEGPPVVGWWDVDRLDGTRGVVCCAHATDAHQDPLFGPGPSSFLDSAACADCGVVVTFDAVSSAIDTF